MSAPVNNGNNIPPNGNNIPPSNNVPINRVRSLINRSRAAVNRMTPETKIRLLRNIAIALYIIGILLCVIGATLMLVFDIPLLALLISVGVAVIIIATICLAKRTELQRADRDALSRPPEDRRTGRRIDDLIDRLVAGIPPNPYTTTDDAPAPLERAAFEREYIDRRGGESSETKQILLSSFRSNFPIPISCDTEEDDNGEITKKTFHNGRHIYVSFAKRNITDRDYDCWSPFDPTLALNTAVVNNVNSTNVGGTSQALKSATTTTSWVNSLPEVRFGSGQFSCGDWVSSLSLSRELGQAERRCPWCVLYQFNGPKATHHNNNPLGAYKVMRVGFRKLLLNCIEKGMHVIQMPLLGCSESELPPLNEPIARENWIRAVLLALIDAINDIDPSGVNEEAWWTGTHGPGGAPKLCISIVDSETIPGCEIVNEY
ncbi:MAG: hypothetical protein RRZ67_04465 [Victivallaceae bacterium]